MGPTTAAPLALRAGEGETYNWFGQVATIKVTAAETGGEMSLIEVEAPAGLAAPLHVHYTEDESFWILEGRVTFEVGDERIEAGPGDCLFAPRNIPHRFETGDEPVRMLFLFNPGGFEDFVRESSDPANQDRLAEIALAHGKELLG